MLNEETKRKLRLMNLGGFIDASEDLRREPGIENLSFDERFQMLTDSVYQRYFNDKVDRLIRAAKLRFPRADVHDIYYDPSRKLKRVTMAEFSTCEYISENRSVVLQGYASSGKTYIGCALAKEACRNMYKTKYIRLPDLLMEYEEAANTSIQKKMKLLNKLSRYQVLIIDEWLMEDLSEEEEYFLFELLFYQLIC